MTGARKAALHAALAHFAARRHAEAQAALEALIAQHGEDAESLLLLATDVDAADALLQQTGEREAALAALRRDAANALGAGQCPR